MGCRRIGVCLLVWLAISLLPCYADDEFYTGTDGVVYDFVPAKEGYIVQSGSATPGDIADGSSYVAVPSRLAKIDIVLVPGAKNIVSDLTACSRSCAAASTCSAFVYCSPGAGNCTGLPDGDIPENGCLLAVQTEAARNKTLPFLVQSEFAFTKDNIISGSPILTEAIIRAPGLDGYLQLYGQSYYTSSTIVDSMYQNLTNCADSLVPTSCVLAGTPWQWKDRCNKDPECGAMTWYPDGRGPDLLFNVTLFKGGNTTIDPSLANLNQHAVTYVLLDQEAQEMYNPEAEEEEEHHDGGVSPGAVAGIAVGCAVAGAALLALIGMFAYKRHKRTHSAQTLVDIEKTVAEADANKLASDASGHQLGTRGGGGGSSSQSQNGRASNGSSMQTSPFAAAAVGVQSRPLSAMMKSPLDTPATWEFAPSPLIGRTSIPPNSQFAATSFGTSSDEIAIMDLNSVQSGTDGARTVKNLDIGGNQDGEPLAAGAATVLEAIKAADWKHYSVDYDAIQWLTRQDGTPWELGRGAFSVVYKVTRDHTQVFAAKVVPLQDRRAEQVFLREAITLFHLRHPNIVQFSSVCIHDKQGILLMELMEGGSLFGCMNMKNSTNARVTGWYNQGRRIAMGIIQALHYLHGLKMVHLDLKSPNVLLTRDFTPKLADVGFTRVWQSMQSESETDSRIGTFAYMAPEILLGGGPITAAADIYSFGVCLREICTGEYPSRGRNRMPSAPEECPQAVIDLILACMKHDPAERPNSQELFSMLSQISGLRPSLSA